MNSKDFFSFWQYNSLKNLLCFLTYLISSQISVSSQLQCRFAVFLPVLLLYLLASPNLTTKTSSLSDFSWKAEFLGSFPWAIFPIENTDFHGNNLNFLCFENSLNPSGSFGIVHNGWPFVPVAWLGFGCPLVLKGLFHPYKSLSFWTFHSYLGTSQFFLILLHSFIPSQMKPIVSDTSQWSPIFQPLSLDYKFIRSWVTAGNSFTKYSLLCNKDPSLLWWQTASSLPTC